MNSDSDRASFKSTLRRALKAVVLPVWDVIDGTCLKITAQSGLPPRSLRKYVAPLEQFVTDCEEYIAYSKCLGDLRMSDTVLDIGCGPGRFAARLVANPHFFHGDYHGFDPDRRCIEWANAHVASAHPNMRFSQIDLSNHLYNPAGTIDAATFKFPFPENHFDFAYAWSIFTHLLPEVTTNYLGEIRRVLKPGKKALLTCMLLDGYPASLREDIIQRRALKGVTPLKWHHCGPYSVLHPDEPERVTAYQRDFFVERIGMAGLQLVHTYNGCWNHLENYFSEQDFVIVAKPAA
jgi:SAM-dependent methyltransferase